MSEKNLLDNSLHLKIIDDCVNDALILQGKALSLTEEKESVIIKVQQAKLWIKSKQPEYLKFLNHLQSIFHQENTQLFSELLTYFVKDVLNKDKEIVFELYTYHNLPALRIEAKQNGNSEDIYAGNGGSIVNIVSTGLRLIALSRMKNRKFIVLDEPDCWLKPDHVPFFAKIIGEISSQLGIQTVIISHHDWSYFKDYGRVVELSLQGNHLQADIIHDTEFDLTPEEYEKADLIKSVRLVRFMSHYDTTFELHPHLTCIIGENDIGKSVLATALRALAYNDSSDSYIRHNETEAQVYVTLTQYRSILWQRFAKTTQENPQKVKYSLFLNNDISKPAHHEFNSNTTPDFIQKELLLCTIEDIDIHINNQKQPVFLISNDTKPQQKAKILSLGQEALYIQKIMEKIKQKTKIFKQEEKDGEIRYEQINKIVSILENIEEIVNTGKVLRSDFNEAVKVLEETQNNKDFVLQWAGHDEISVLGKISLPETPVLHNLDEDYFIYKNLNLNQQLSDLGSITLEGIHTPNIEDLDEIKSLRKQLHYYQNLSHIGPINSINDFVVPEIIDIQELRAQFKQFIKYSEISKIPLINFNKFEIPDIQDISQMRAGLQQWHKIINFSSLEKINLDIEPPHFQDVSEDIYLLNRWKESIDSINQNKKEYLLLMEQVNLAEKEVDEFFAKTGNVCPTCKQPVSAEHIHNM